MIFPQKLQKGDEVRIIAPAMSYRIIGEDVRLLAKERIEKMGLKVSFGKNIELIDGFVSSPISARIEDLHEAYRDASVKAIFTVIGGWNSNELLGYIDYELIKNNPKMLIGYSDITALQNAILAKTGVVSYSGPHYSTLGMKYGTDYTITNLEKILFGNDMVNYMPSDEWSDDPEWFIDQEKRIFKKNNGIFIVNAGSAKGVLLGGEMTTLQLLFGTHYMPEANDIILALEIAEIAANSSKPMFERILQSIIQQTWFKNVRGILIGRMQDETGLPVVDIKMVADLHPELKDMPILANIDFGHTYPLITLPIGGEVEIKDGSISIVKH
jgi:muramoyltetrapeptide carboxypeptidase LdcA involved in peptidoglycan recycling